MVSISIKQDLLLCLLLKLSWLIQVLVKGSVNESVPFLVLQRTEVLALVSDGQKQHVAHTNTIKNTLPLEAKLLEGLPLKEKNQSSLQKVVCGVFSGNLKTVREAEVW